MSRIPSCNVVIEDRGDRRVVTIDGPHFDMAGLRRDRETFETSYSREVIELMHGLKGSQYLKDEIDRGEEPAYIRSPLEAAIRPIVDLKGKVVLDFGSGCGASSINLCRIGADEVHGIPKGSAGNVAPIGTVKPIRDGRRIAPHSGHQAVCRLAWAAPQQEVDDVKKRLGRKEIGPAFVKEILYHAKNFRMGQRAPKGAFAHALF